MIGAGYIFFQKTWVAGTELIYHKEEIRKKVHTDV